MLRCALAVQWSFRQGRRRRYCHSVADRISTHLGLAERSWRLMLRCALAVQIKMRFEFGRVCAF